MPHGTASRSEFSLYRKLQTAVLDQMPPPEAFEREVMKKVLVSQAALQRGLAPLAEGRFDGFTKTPKPNLRFDKRKDGWELLEHAPRRIVSVADLEPVPFLRQDESSIRGYDLIGRARYELDANLGQEDAEFILEHEAETPESLQSFYLVCTATIWRSPGGGLRVACLYCRGGRWTLRWGWLERDFGLGVRLLRPRK